VAHKYAFNPPEIRFHLAPNFFLPMSRTSARTVRCLHGCTTRPNLLPPLSVGISNPPSLEYRGHVSYGQTNPASGASSPAVDDKATAAGVSARGILGEDRSMFF
jgi:hypothetical protein